MTATVTKLSDRAWMPARPWSYPAGRFVVSAPHAESPPEVRERWLAERRRMCTASDVAALFGVSPWSDEWSVWAEKTQRVEPEAQTYPMLRGQVLEDAVVQLWAATIDYPVKTRRVGLIQSLAHPLIGASIDRLSVCPRGRCIQETKTAVNDREWAGDEVPVQTQFQVTQQLLASGRDHAHVVYLDGRLQVHERILERDEDLMGDIVARVESWWQEHIIEDVEPPASGRSLADVARLYGDPVDDAVHVLDGDNAAAPGRVDALTGRIAELVRERDDLIARVKQAAGDATLIKAADGKTEWTWRATARIAGATKTWRDTNRDLIAPHLREQIVEQLDMDALIKEHPDLLGNGAALYRVRQLNRVKH